MKVSRNPAANTNDLLTTRQRSYPCERSPLPNSSLRFTDRPTSLPVETWSGSRAQALSTFLIDAADPSPQTRPSTRLSEHRSERPRDRLPPRTPTRRLPKPAAKLARPVEAESTQSRGSGTIHHALASSGTMKVYHAAWTPVGQRARTSAAKRGAVQKTENHCV